MTDPNPAPRRHGPDSAEALTLALFAKFDTVAFVIASACTAALLMFLATATLLVTDSGGHPVGPNLSAFSTFWPGYSVTWVGAVVGALYAGLAGGLVGLALAVFWNFAHIVILGLAALRHGPLDLR